MTPLPTTSRSFIGYTRVSTVGQQLKNGALDRQTSEIVQTCGRLSVPLEAVYDDMRSAVGPHSGAKRPGLMEALAHAQRIGGVLIVTDVTRLFRDPVVGMAVLGKFGVDVYSIAAGRIVNAAELRDGFDAGAERADAIHRGTMEKLAALKSTGTPSTPRDHLLAASKQSALSRKRTSLEVIEQIADILAEDLTYRSLKHPALAAMLNQRGIRTGWGREWTPGSLRRARSKALAVLSEREELQAIVDLEMAPDFGSSAVVDRDDEHRTEKMDPLENFGRF